ncbi:MAG: hypothetical protein J7M19_01425 [Planctomycetes bacterium]|nr:hypothetical protein [Planctomycetota bacterium]
MLVFGWAVCAALGPMALFAIATCGMLLLALAAWAAQPGPGAPATAVRLDKWKVIGPGGGGAQYIPTVSPHNPRKVLVRCDMTGSYISGNGGRSWRMFNIRGVVQFFVFDPVDPDTIYAKSSALYRSSDSGRTWQLVYPRPSKVRRVAMHGDEADEGLVTTGRYRDSVVALAVDPVDSKTLYAAIECDGDARLYTSGDRGKTWKRGAVLPAGAMRIYIDPDSPESDRTIYVVGANSLAVREGGAWTNRPGPRGAEAFTDVSAGFPAGGGAPTIYVTARCSWRGRTLAGGIYVSQNGGQTWRHATGDLARQTSTPLPGTWIRAVAACQTNPDVAYIGFKNLALGRGKTAFFGSARTDDAGRTWKILVKEKDPGKSAPGMKDAWLSDLFGPIWGDAPRYLGVDPNNPNTCFSTDDGRTMRTTDGGDTWHACYSKRARGGTWTTTGLDVLTCYGVHFDPFDKKRIFISYTDIGLFVSENGGSSWKSATTKGVPPAWTNTTYWMEFDPDVRGRVWAVMTGIHDLPRTKMWRNLAVSRYNGGVVVSNDSGKTWKRSMRGMPETAATHILLDPESPLDARVLYVTGFGTGVWKSTNGGKSWTLKNNGLPAKEPFAWRMARDKNGVLYLVIARRSKDGGYGNAGDGALYRSADGAESWEKVPLPRGVNGPNGIAIDPKDPKRLYLAAWCRNTSKGIVNGGVFLSTDAGGTWKNVLSRDQYVYDVTVDPRRPNVIYSSSFESSVRRSDDRGRTWKRVKGYNFKWAHRVIPDPYNPRMIYVTTFGGSVWYGPARGDPNAAEDIITPVTAYGK